MLVHEDGVHVPELDRIYTHQRVHDPSDLEEARRLAEPGERLRLGVLYRNETLPRYEETRQLPSFTADQKIELLNAEFDRYAV